MSCPSYGNLLPKRQYYPVHPALFDSAHARVLANRQAHINATIAAVDPGRNELCDQPTVGSMDTRRGIRELMKERMAADEAADLPKKVEDRDAEVIYKPNDALVSQWRVEGRAFETSRPPPNGTSSGITQDDAVTEAYTATVNANRGPRRYNQDDFRLRDIPPHHRRLFSLPRHPPSLPAVPQQLVEGPEAYFMESLLEDYVEKN